MACQVSQWAARASVDLVSALHSSLARPPPKTTTTKPTHFGRLSLALSCAMLLLLLLLLAPMAYSANTNLLLESSACSLDNGAVAQSSNEVDRILMLFHCHVGPLVRLFAGKLLAHLRRTATDLNGELAVTSDWQKLADLIGHFYSESKWALERSGPFCSFAQILRLSQLGERVTRESSSLMGYAYDLVTIEFHKRCLVNALSNLPKVPYLVRDVVNIYLEGADKTALPDLNGDVLVDLNGEALAEAAASLMSAGPQRPLAEAMSLLLTIPSGREGVASFREACKGFAMELEQRWQSMEMASSMLANERNGIRRLNNHVARLLTPMQYADLCSRLSSLDS